MAQMTNRDFIENAILNGVRKRVQEIQEEEIAEAMKRVKGRLSREIDSLALKMLSFYQVKENAQEVVITVSKGALVGEQHLADPAIKPTSQGD